MKKRKKTGGTWNPDEEFIHFLASTAWGVMLDEGTRFKADILLGLHTLKDGMVRRLEAGTYAGRYLIDSGIYVLAAEFARRTQMPFNEVLAMPPEGIEGWDHLRETWYETLDRLGSTSWGYVELDIGGSERKTRLREEAEARGLSPIPVYHPLTDEPDYFKALCQEYDRVMMGNFAQGSKEDRLRQLALAWEVKRKYPDVWIHLLGISPSEWMLAYPVNSSDSSAWLSSVMWKGLRPKTSLRQTFSMAQDFQYRLKDSSGWIKGCASGLYEAILDERGYRDATGRLEEMGARKWPPIMDAALPKQGAGDIPA